MYYALERLWKDCPLIDLPADARGGDGAAAEAEYGTGPSDGSIRLSGDGF